MSDYTAEQFVQRELEIVERGKALVAPSLIDELLGLCAEDRDAILDSLSPLDCYRLLYDWRSWARPKQLEPPGGWTIWLSIGGRGSGKTLTGSEWIQDRVETGRARSILIIGPDWKDLRRYQVGGFKGLGGSGLLDVSSPWCKPTFLEQKGEVHWPNGAVAYLQTAERSELRGANLDTIWGDEPVKWRYAEALWSNVELTLREAGTSPPRVLVTTTPADMPLLRDLMMDRDCVTVHSVTTENQQNVAPEWIRRMRQRLGGTRLGLQELEARMLSDHPDALFHMSLINAHRVAAAPELRKILVGVDPAVSTRRRSDETGIVAAGAGLPARRGDSPHAYVLADATDKLSPDGWTRAAVDVATSVGADGFVVERNRIGDLAKHAILCELRRRGIENEYTIEDVLSLEDKAARAAPVSAEYEAGRVHHVGRGLGALEAEISGWQPRHGRSPNRMDALVHVLYALLHLEKDAEEVADPAAGFKGLSAANARFGGFGWGGRTI